MLEPDPYDKTLPGPARRGQEQRYNNGDGPWVRRNHELMSFENPAMSNIVEVVERYANPGWIKTGLLEEACLYCCLVTELHRWRREADRDDAALIQRMEKELPPEIVESERRMASQWSLEGLEEFYTQILSNRFATVYRISDPSITKELRNIPFDSPTPDFRRRRGSVRP